MGKVQTAEDLINASVVLVGSPATVREKLEQYQEVAGFNNSLTKPQFGTMPSAQARTNAAAIAEEIIPYFRQKVTKKAAAE